jgi:exosome complex component RRP46
MVIGTRERALESRLLAALSPLVIRTHHPRSLLQINVQIVEATDHTDAVALLPVCINAATLALIDAGTPLKSVLVATTVLLGEDGEVVKESVNGGSRHVLGFVKDGKCVFVESVGTFDEKAFGNAVQEGMRECALELEDMMEVDAGAKTVGMVVRRAVEQKVGKDMRWRE